MSIKVALIDDHTIVLEGLRLLLRKETDLEIVGVGKCGEDALRLARESRPDVLVMDLVMPGMSGLEATRQLLGEWPEAKILVLSVECERPMVMEMLRAGVRGYIIKDAAINELVRGIRVVAGGGKFLCSRITSLIVHDFLNRVPLESTVTFAGMTVREREVLGLIADGLTTKEIAFRLGVSLKTVDSQRQSLMKKLDLFSTAELTKYAVRKGLSSLGRDTPLSSENS